MKKLERELNDMTELAKPELERHNRQRLIAMQKALIHLAESEVIWILQTIWAVISLLLLICDQIFAT